MTIDDIATWIDEDGTPIDRDTIRRELSAIAEAANLPANLTNDEADDLSAGWYWLQIIRETPELLA